jgi:L-ascorbate metabolism protein UlaG (beta-lactamase superfamily)
MTLRSLSALCLVLAAVACSRAGETPVSAVTPTASATAPATPQATPAVPAAAAGRPGDVIATSQGELRITPLHHATMLLTWQGKSLYVDPFHEAKFDGLPKADTVFISDVHFDHLDPAALDAIAQPATVIVAPPAVATQLPKGYTHVVVLKNGDRQTVDGVGVEAIPMYNLTRGPSAGTLFHDKGRGNGYVLTFGDKRVYLSGDTECTGEMRALKSIDVAFVCMNLPYTMPPSEAAACIQAFRPKVVYPYHYRGSNLSELTGALAGDHDIEVRLRSWY